MSCWCVYCYTRVDNLYTMALEIPRENPYMLLYCIPALDVVLLATPFPRIGGVARETSIAPPVLG